MLVSEQLEIRLFTDLFFQGSHIEIDCPGGTNLQLSGFAAVELLLIEGPATRAIDVSSGHLIVGLEVGI